MKAMKPRKQYLLILPAMGLFVFAACSTDIGSPDIDHPVAAIVSGSICEEQDNVTRASATAWDAGDLIGISAASPGKTARTNIRFRAKNAAGNFEVVNASGENNAIYFEDRKDVRFTAYYPYEGTNETKPGADGIISRTITVESQNPDRQSDLDFLWAQTTANFANPQVRLDFVHVMSRIRLNFIQGNGVTFPDESVSFSFSGLKYHGRFDTSTGIAAAIENSASGLVGPFVATTPFGGTSPQATLIVWPHEVGLFRLYVDANINGITTTFSGMLAFTRKSGASKTDLLPGKSYTFNITVENEGIDIGEAEVTSWKDKWTNGTDVTARPDR